MAFIQDPRLRQTWNQLSHTTEAVTSDAAAGIWTFGHRYITPCLASLAGTVDSCCALCLGDRDERARRARERDRGARRPLPATTRSRAEFRFDFYDDWEEDFLGGDDEFSDGGGGEDGGGRGIFGGDWDRLLAGTGTGYARRQGGGGSGGGGGGGGDVVDQPRRKRGMSYGTRGAVRRKVPGEEDPNVIPRTAPLGFLGRLPFKIVGSLRYKPSAANLQEHPGGGTVGMEYHGDGGAVEEHEPLLGGGDGDDPRLQGKRPRSDTTMSGDTSSSYRSRGDLFPSDGEGDEDAVPLDDEFTVALERIDDRGSTKTRSSKGKRRADRDRDLSRTVSRSTISSSNTPDEFKVDSNPVSPSFQEVEGTGRVFSLEDLRREEELAEREEYEENERRRRAASQLAIQRGLSKDGAATAEEILDETKDDTADHGPPFALVEGLASRIPGSPAGDEDVEEVEEPKPPPATPPEAASSPTKKTNGEARNEGTFVPARLPHFG
ncbi:hypothetical protein C8A00DRAFT_12713 [Chaetomidium leptoderma]|uniref:Uncharacterized protein n=1 Tax=Chaetomidium leptoderma TaxID=669021 RepID=A0AAN6VU95_9PEZI|nr:hypothetical protein C8A00DRAFT_12713 [Chaetomidium leptoderma]